MKETGCGCNILELHSGVEYLRDEEKDETLLKKKSFVHITRPTVMTMVIATIIVMAYLLTHIALELKTPRLLYRKIETTTWPGYGSSHPPQKLKYYETLH